MEIQGYDMPDDLYYEENHYWIRVEDDMLVMGKSGRTGAQVGSVTERVIRKARCPVVTVD